MMDEEIRFGIIVAFLPTLAVSVISWLLIYDGRAYWGEGLLQLLKVFELACFSFVVSVGVYCLRVKKIHLAGICIVIMAMVLPCLIGVGLARKAYADNRLHNDMDWWRHILVNEDAWQVDRKEAKRHLTSESAEVLVAYLNWRRSGDIANSRPVPEPVLYLLNDVGVSVATYCPIPEILAYSHYQSHPDDVYLLQNPSFPLSLARMILSADNYDHILELCYNDWMPDDFVKAEVLPRIQILIAAEKNKKNPDSVLINRFNSAIQNYGEKDARARNYIRQYGPYVESASSKFLSLDDLIEIHLRHKDDRNLYDLVGIK